ncbi:helix-turn-helix transcriptional regulator [Haloechinothrix salitolerans]|uniref:Helix-turn-helix domain-containing protein n=1 Tax=Haloechinothrix salitolerans TaxID=926830 RepID=A0ABW2BZY8_9PSEU
MSPRVVTDPRLVAFGRALAAARKARGYTLDELANLSGVSRRTVSYLEGGLSNPQLLTIAALARALEVDAAELIQPVDEVDPPPAE